MTKFLLIDDGHPLSRVLIPIDDIQGIAEAADKETKIFLKELGETKVSVPFDVIASALTETTKSEAEEDCCCASLNMFDYLHNAKHGQMFLDNVFSVTYSFENKRVVCAITLNNGRVFRSHPVNSTTIGKAMDIAITVALNKAESPLQEDGGAFYSVPVATKYKGRGVV